MSPIPAECPGIAPGAASQGRAVSPPGRPPSSTHHGGSHVAAATSSKNEMASSRDRSTIGKLGAAPSTHASTASAARNRRPRPTGRRGGWRPSGVVAPACAHGAAGAVGSGGPAVKAGAGEGVPATSAPAASAGCGPPADAISPGDPGRRGWPARGSVGGAAPVPPAAGGPGAGLAATSPAGPACSDSWCAEGTTEAGYSPGTGPCCRNLLGLGSRQARRAWGALPAWVAGGSPGGGAGGPTLPEWWPAAHSWFLF